MHDIGKSGWWVLIPLVPLIGAIWFLILLCKKGEGSGAKFTWNGRDKEIIWLCILSLPVYLAVNFINKPAIISEIVNLITPSDSQSEIAKLIKDSDSKSAKHKLTEDLLTDYDIIACSTILSSEIDKMDLSQYYPTNPTDLEAKGIPYYSAKTHPIDEVWYRHRWGDGNGGNREAETWTKIFAYWTNLYLKYKKLAISLEGYLMWINDYWENNIHWFEYRYNDDIAMSSYLKQDKVLEEYLTGFKEFLPRLREYLFDKYIDKIKVIDIKFNEEFSNSVSSTWYVMYYYEDSDLVSHYRYTRFIIYNDKYDFNLLGKGNTQEEVMRNYYRSKD